MTEATPKTQGIFINGKAKIIKMLQYLSKDEREKILTHIRIKNPGLALELWQESYSFIDFLKADKNVIARVSKRIDASILGVALRNVPEDYQRKVLLSVGRDVSEKAFQAMHINLSNEKDSVSRAQNKVLQVFSITMQ